MPAVLPLTNANLSDSFKSMATPSSDTKRRHVMRTAAQNEAGDTRRSERWLSARAIDYNLANPSPAPDEDDAPETRSRSADNARRVVLCAHVLADDARDTRLPAVPHLVALLRAACVGAIHRIPGPPAASLARGETARSRKSVGGT